MPAVIKQSNKIVSNEVKDFIQSLSATRAMLQEKKQTNFLANPMFTITNKKSPNEYATTRWEIKVGFTVSPCNVIILCQQFCSTF